MSKGWFNDSVPHSVARKFGSSGRMSKSSSWRRNKASTFNEVSKISNRDIALWHSKEARKELKKDVPDYDVVNYHIREARIYNRLKPVVVPASMVKGKLSKSEAEKEYARV